MATELTHVVSGFYRGENLLDLEKLILWELGQVQGTTASYDKFPKWLIRKKLNARQNRYVFETQCLQRMALVRAKDKLKSYRLPVDCMENGVISVKYFTSSTAYEDLEITDVESMDRKHQGYLTWDDGDPEYVFTGNMYGNIPMMEVAPAPDADGTAYESTTDTGIMTGTTMPSASTNITGQATGGSGTTLTDTETTFTDQGIVGGMYVANVTDGSTAPVLSVATNTITLASTLSGGTDNTFSAGDSYEVLVGDYGVIIDWESSDQYAFESEVGLLSDITVPAGNFLVHYITYPIEFPATGNDDQFPDIPKVDHQGALVPGVVADILGSFHEKTKEFKRAALYEARFAKAVQDAKANKQRPFKEKPVSIRPRIR